MPYITDIIKEYTRWRWLQFVVWLSAWIPAIVVGTIGAALFFVVWECLLWAARLKP